MSIEERVASDLKSAASRVRGRPAGVEEIRRRASRRRRIVQGGWIAAALVVLAGVSVLATSLIPQPVDLADPPTPSEILADNAVTTEEWEAAGAAVVECLSDRGQDAEFDPSEGSFSIASTAEDAFNECYGAHMGDSVQQRWSSQQYDPVADFEFYRDVVECTESRTDVDFGEMTQDSLGFASTEAQRTINRAIEAAPDAYHACLDEIVQSRGS